MTITIDQFIEQNVIANVSALVADLAEAYLNVPDFLPVSGLTEKAHEACRPVGDYESAAREEGLVQDAYEDIWLAFDHDQYADHREADAHDALEIFEHAEDACRALMLDPYEHEILEHWFVSDRLADHLERHGERIVRDFAGHNVWGRTTSGQAIKCDPVIEAIFAETQNREM